MTLSRKLDTNSYDKKENTWKHKRFIKLINFIIEEPLRGTGYYSYVDAKSIKYNKECISFDINFGVRKQRDLFDRLPSESKIGDLRLEDF